MAKSRFSAVLTLPVEAKGLLKTGKVGRSAIRVRSAGQATTINIEAEDMPSFRAAVNSTVRDMTVIGSVSQVIGKRQRV